MGRVTPSYALHPEMVGRGRLDAKKKDKTIKFIIDKLELKRYNVDTQAEIISRLRKTPHRIGMAMVASRRDVGTQWRTTRWKRKRNKNGCLSSMKERITV